MKLCITTISKTLKMKKIHRKRVRRVVVKSKSYLDSLQKKRTQFLTRIRRIDTHTIISIDEAGFYKQMVPTYGYCQVGKRFTIQPKDVVTVSQYMLSLIHI